MDNIKMCYMIMSFTISEKKQTSITIISVNFKQETQLKHSAFKISIWKWAFYISKSYIKIMLKSLKNTISKGKCCIYNDENIPQATMSL